MFLVLCEYCRIVCNEIEVFRDVSARGTWFAVCISAIMGIMLLCVQGERGWQRWAVTRDMTKHGASLCNVQNEPVLNDIIPLISFKIQFYDFDIISVFINN
ncbi:hypothetical protein CS369_18960 [Candidatus Symbiopectobacterium sp. 'North America']|nr:hypothetical protein [Candidatus Symbiopectobacterium sp. 'North America']